ncbi:unnamed protein product, partial [Effrenium voratum]
RSAPAAKQPGQPTQPTQPTQQGQPSQAAGHEAGSAVVFRDYTKVPKQMDEQFERLAPESALRPTILNVGSAWSKRSQRALLAEPTSATLGPDEQKSQKNAAFDLLDAITKSGALPLSHASLHIVIAATHCFDKTVTETVVQENCNPIERVERSSLIMASTVHQETCAGLGQRGGAAAGGRCQPAAAGCLGHLCRPSPPECRPTGGRSGRSGRVWMRRSGARPFSGKGAGSILASPEIYGHGLDNLPVLFLVAQVIVHR